MHRYLEDVLGNKASITLLRTMINYQGKIFTIRGLAEEAKVTPNEAALTIHDLERCGIVKIQPVGRAYQLELNKRSYILDKIIEPMIESEKNTMSKMLELLKKYLDTTKIISAAIFGSVVKGQEKMDSDIDLLVVSNDHEHAIKQISEVAEQIFLIFHGSISPVVFTKKEFKAKQKGSLIRSITDNHILICGFRIETL
ncbi:MAG: nucleotidyltransferase domain-containing protein [Candidatus Nitrosotalea sp.]|nr:nucleotidyltransferase domain-containing protein [Candidatus Nitrosotalea sp.]